MAKVPLFKSGFPVFSSGVPVFVEPAAVADCICCGGTTPCNCISLTDCSNCPPSGTPISFRVTISGVTICPGCIVCVDLGVSIRFDACDVNGTYNLTQNGDCAWTAPLACTAQLFLTTDCSGPSTTIGFSLNLVRISPTQFAFQITDDSNLLLIFDQTITTAACCTSFTMNNAITACGCYFPLTAFGVEGMGLGTGGTANFTPCACCPAGLPTSYALDGDAYTDDPIPVFLCHFHLVLTATIPCEWRGTEDGSCLTLPFDFTFILRTVGVGSIDNPCDWVLTMAENGGFQHTYNPADPRGVYDRDANWVIESYTSPADPGLVLHNVTVS